MIQALAKAGMAPAAINDYLAQETRTLAELLDPQSEEAQALFQSYRNGCADAAKVSHCDAAGTAPDEGNMDDARSAAMATTGDRSDDAESLFRIRFTDRLMPRRD